MRAEGVETISGLQEKCLARSFALERPSCKRSRSRQTLALPRARVLRRRSRAADFYRWLRTFPFVRIWLHRRLARRAMPTRSPIMLQEEGLYRLALQDLRDRAEAPWASRKAKLGPLADRPECPAKRLAPLSRSRRQLDSSCATFTPKRRVSPPPVTPRCWGSNIRLRAGTTWRPTARSTSSTSSSRPHLADIYGPVAAYRAHRHDLPEPRACSGSSTSVATARLAGTPHANAYEPVAACPGLFRRIR